MPPTGELAVPEVERPPETTESGPNLGPATATRELLEEATAALPAADRSPEAIIVSSSTPEVMMEAEKVLETEATISATAETLEIVTAMPPTGKCAVPEVERPPETMERGPNLEAATAIRELPEEARAALPAAERSHEANIVSSSVPEVMLEAEQQQQDSLQYKEDVKQQAVSEEAAAEEDEAAVEEEHHAVIFEVQLTEQSLDRFDEAKQAKYQLAVAGSLGCDRATIVRMRGGSVVVETEAIGFLNEADVQGAVRKVASGICLDTSEWGSFSVTSPPRQITKMYKASAALRNRRRQAAVVAVTTATSPEAAVAETTASEAEKFRKTDEMVSATKAMETPAEHRENRTATPPTANVAVVEGLGQVERPEETNKGDTSFDPLMELGKLSQEATTALEEEVADPSPETKEEKSPITEETALPTQTAESPVEGSEKRTATPPTANLASAEGLGQVERPPAVTNNDTSLQAAMAPKEPPREATAEATVAEVAAARPEAMITSSAKPDTQLEASSESAANANVAATATKAVLGAVGVRESAAPVAPMASVATLTEPSASPLAPEIPTLRQHETHERVLKTDGPAKALAQIDDALIAEHASPVSVSSCDGAGALRTIDRDASPTPKRVQVTNVVETRWLPHEGDDLASEAAAATADLEEMIEMAKAADRASATPTPPLKSRRLATLIRSKTMNESAALQTLMGTAQEVLNKLREEKEAAIAATIKARAQKEAFEAKQMEARAEKDAAQARAEAIKMEAAVGAARAEEEQQKSLAIVQRAADAKREAQVAAAAAAAEKAAVEAQLEKLKAEILMKKAEAKLARRKKKAKRNDSRRPSKESRRPSHEPPQCSSSSKA
eukprot:TRINITY_DN22421_c0_g1_i6.p1 TRINITY_DN22421_c0_g1~~TRINITY_DN22421_c0_g1_i6.p1  ORF type:complete len:884 (-),score=248.31 TRINITY_DN22421_c0_g1_i6:87-2636(-)